MLLPIALGGTELIAWRLDQAIHTSTWDTGDDAYRVGGLWNSKGMRAVYCSIDPTTAILEGAVHKDSRALDTILHTLTAAVIADMSEIHIVGLASVPNASWLRPGMPGTG